MSLSLRQKLILTIAALLLVQIAASAINLTTITTYRENTRIIADDTLREVAALGEVDAAANQLLYESLGVVVQGQQHAEHRIAAQERLREALDEIGHTDDMLNDAAAEVAAAEELRQASVGLIAASDKLAAGVGINFGALADDLERQHELFDTALDKNSAIIDQERGAAIALAQRNPIMLPSLLGSVAVTLSLLLLAIIVFGVLRPLDQLRAANEAVVGGDFNQRVPVVRNDEIGRTAKAFNAMITHITQQQQAIGERAAALEEANVTQSRLLETVQALSVPAIPVDEGVLALPLLGALDTHRAQRVTSALLERVTQEHAHTVILDVTALAAVDSATAGRLLQLAQSVQLLGACLIITGISAEMAQQLVALDIDLSRLVVRGTLREGLALALSHQHAHTNGNGHANGNGNGNGQTYANGRG